MIALLAVSTVYIAFRSGTSVGGHSTEVTETRTRQANGTLVVGTVGQIGNTIDPAGTASPLGTTLIRNIDDGLVDYAPGSTRVVPALAVNWTSSSGNTIWTFNLRQNITFPDGTPFNASVESYSVNRSMSLDYGSFANNGLDTLILNVSVLGPYQVEFQLAHPSAVSFATDTSLDPVDPEVAGSELTNYTGTVSTEDPNGLGPYLLANWTKANGNDVSVSLTANPFYWNASAGYPRISNVTILFYSNKASLLAALAAGNLDVAYVDLSFGGLTEGDVSSFASNPAFHVWSAQLSLAGPTVVVTVPGITGVTFDPNGGFRYYLLGRTS